MAQDKMRRIMIRHAALWIALSAMLLVITVGAALALALPPVGAALGFPPQVLTVLAQVVMLASWGVVGVIPPQWSGRVTPFRAIVALLAVADLLVLALVVWGPLDSVPGVIFVGTPFAVLACVLRAAATFVWAGRSRL